MGPAIVLNAFRSRPALRFDLPAAPHATLQVADARRCAASRALAGARQHAAGHAALVRRCGSFNSPPPTCARVHRSLAETQADPALLGSDGMAARRAAVRGGLDALAQRIESRVAFDDLVAPPWSTAQLRDIAMICSTGRASMATGALAAHHGRGLGTAALFAGESGTGKT